MYKVFINEKVIYFTNDKENYRQLYNCLIVSFFVPTFIPGILDLLTYCRKTEVVIIVVPNYEEAFTQFQSYFKIIEAAGGIVNNKNGEKLFIYRLDKWDLPKGKIEKNEKIEEAAIREIEEECGISNLTIKKPLTETYHIYKLHKKLILKRTYWFEMESDFVGKLIPQLEENITKAEWLNDEQIKDKVMENTYSSIANLLTTNVY